MAKEVREEEMILGCVRGSREAQRALYDHYSPRLFGICLMYATDQMDAEDTLHDGFMKIFAGIGQYEGKGSFEGWMRRIIVNTALEKYRRGKRLQSIMEEVRYEQDRSEEQIISSLTAGEIMEAVMELPPRYRISFLLYSIEGYSHKEIAERLGISEGTSKSNLSRARSILQGRLRAYYEESLRVSESEPSIIPMTR